MQNMMVTLYKTSVFWRDKHIKKMKKNPYVYLNKPKIV